MRKFIQFPDGAKQELSPIAYDEFCHIFRINRYQEETGGEAYDRFLRINHYVELSDFNLKGCVIVLEDGEPKFNLPDSLE
jgi:hypothetical protein